MTDLMKCRETESGNIHTPKGRMVFPALFKPQLPKGETDESKAKYQITLLFPEDADLTLLEEAIDEKMADEFKAADIKRGKIKTPFLDTADQERYAEYADDYPVMIRLNANFKPDVVTPNGKGTVDEDDEADEVYGGRWARVSVRPFAWSHPTGGKGVSLGLQNVQLLDHDEPIAGGRVKGVNEFAPVESNALEDLE